MQTRIDQTFLETNIITQTHKIKNDRNYVTLIDFLIDVYPDGFDVAYKIFVNDKIIELKDYDIKLKSSDTIHIVLHPAWGAVAGFALKAAIGLAIGYGMQQLFGTNQPNLPSSVDYKNTSASPTYGITNNQNQMLAGAPVPVTYGTVRTYPSLITKPYLRYENNEQYLYSLMTLGHGLYNINDVFIENSNVETLDNGIFEYKRVFSNEYKNECTLRDYIGDPNYNQHVYTSPEVSQLEILPGKERTVDRMRFEGNTLHLYRAKSGLFPLANAAIGDKITFIEGSNAPVGSIPPGIHNNIGTKIVTGVDTLNHTITFDDTLDELYRDVFLDKTQDVKDNTSITGADNLIMLNTSISTSNTFENDFKIGQIIEYDGVLVVITDILFQETISSSTITLSTTGTNFVSNKILKANDIVATYEFENSYGYFQTNPTGTNAKYIEVDITFPYGLYRSDTQGNLLSRKINFNITVKDETGKESIHTYSIVDSTKTAVRKSIVVSVDDLSFGTYSTKIQRTTAEALDSSTVDKLFVERIKTPIIIVNDNKWDDMTLLWVKTKASDSISQLAQYKINCNITRFGVGNTLQDVVEDLYSNTVYGAGQDANNIVGTQMNETFNGTFETRISVLDAMRAVAVVGRYIITPKNSEISIKKDNYQTINKFHFNDTNIIKDSFSAKYSFGLSDIEDGVEVEYRDPNSFKPLVVRYPDNSLNPVKTILFGITDINIAYREAQYRYKKLTKQTKSYQFSTGIQGLIPEHLDKINISHQSMSSGEPNEIVKIIDNDTSVTILLKHNETGKVSSLGYNMVYLIDGITPSELKIASKVREKDNLVIIKEPLSSLVGMEVGQKIILYSVYEHIHEAIITNISPNSADTVMISAVNYDSSIYEDTQYVEPTEDNVECAWSGFGYIWSDTTNYNTGEIIVCSNRTQYVALSNNTNENPCDGTNPNWEALDPEDPRYVPDISDTPKMPGEDDNGNIVEIPVEQPEEPSVNWAALAGITILGGLIAWGAQAGLEALFGECDFGMHYHEDTNTCEFCPENEEYDEATNTCKKCDDGYIWDSNTKTCVLRTANSGTGVGNLWLENKKYSDGDIVSFDYVAYISLYDDNTGNQPDIETEMWQVIEGGEVQPTGLWKNDITYIVGNIVSYTEKIFISLVNSNINFQPDNNPTRWKETLEQGIPGVKGDTGDCSDCPNDGGNPECEVLFDNEFGYVDYNNYNENLTEYMNTVNSTPIECSLLSPIITDGCDLIIKTKNKSGIFPNGENYEIDCGKGWMSKPSSGILFKSTLMEDIDYIKYRMTSEGILDFEYIEQYSDYNSLQIHYINNSNLLKGINLPTKSILISSIQFYKDEPDVQLLDCSESSRLKTICVPTGKQIVVKDMSFEFDRIYNSGGLYSTGEVSKLNTSNVTTLERCFLNNSRLQTSTVFDTSNVVNMDEMFRNCDNLMNFANYDCSSVITANKMLYDNMKIDNVVINMPIVTNIEDMFNGCYNITNINITAPLVTNGSYMFASCPLLDSVTGDLSSVTNGSYMFSGAGEINLNNLPDLSNIVDATNMFINSKVYGTASFPNIVNVNINDYMFRNCHNPLKDINITLENIQTSTSQVFRDCEYNKITLATKLSYYSEFYDVTADTIHYIVPTPPNAFLRHSTAVKHGILEYDNGIYEIQLTVTPATESHKIITSSSYKTKIDIYNNLSKNIEFTYEAYNRSIWSNAFDEHDCFHTITINSMKLTESIKMFANATKLITIKGTLDTTGMTAADKQDMFLNCPNLQHPTPTEVTELMSANGAIYTYNP